MPEDDTKTVKSGLMILYETASRLDGWHKDQAHEFIRVGEYSLALDSIAYAYLNNGKSMSADQFQLFDKLATIMELDGDPEYEGVARLRARGMPKYAR
jgi:hypothetical protein